MRLHTLELRAFGPYATGQRIDFDRLVMAIWVPLERQAEAESFVADVNKSIGASG